jgi:hypothetical protein
MPQGCFEAWINGPGADFPPDCAAATRLWLSIYSNEANFVFGAMLLLPFVVGLIGGIPIVARELEAGTSQTAWSLSPSRTRWLVRQLVPVLALLGIATVFAAGAASVLQGTQPGKVVEHMVLHGPIVVARTLAAFGIGLVLGSIVGRSLPAFIIAIVLCVLLGAAADPLRIDWLKARTIPIEREFAFDGQGYGFGYSWRGPDGKMTPWDEHTYELLIPAGAQLPVIEGEERYEEWLYANGYELVPMGVTNEIARGWLPIETAAMSLIGFAAIGGAVITVNRRRPT